MRARTISATAVVALTAALAAQPVSGALPGAPPPQLSPITLSSTTFNDGDVITMSETGCVDPDTGSGEGLVVVLRRRTDAGRGGYPYQPTVTAPVRPDGSFTGSDTVTQPLSLPGIQRVPVTCEQPASQPGPPDGKVFASRTVDIEVVAPPLPDLTIHAGYSFNYVLPCDVPDSTYGSFTISANPSDQPDFALSVQGTATNPPRQGETVTLSVPADAPAGEHPAVAYCGIADGGTSAYYAGFTVTVTDNEPGPVAPAPAGANPAEPIRANASYTG